MKYNVYIQTNLVDTLDADDTDDIIRIVTENLSDGKYVFDQSRSPDIRIEPIHE